MLKLASFALLVAVASACSNICHYNWQPVCGSDGHTYANQCQLNSFNCRRKSSVSVQYSGECKKAPSCNKICTLNWTPVCGTDGKTYGNQCELESLSCLARKSVTVAHSGECVATKKVCNNICHLDYNPVCGTDGKTYGNRCELESLACKSRKSLTVAHTGKCKATTKAACNNLCTRDYNPVCGSDGKTYSNRCELDAFACKSKKAVSMVAKGECKKACNNLCTRDYNPVCGSDGKTYSNRCELDAFACKAKKAVSVASVGECMKAAPAKTAACSTICTFDWTPVCGTNGVTYGNRCQLESQACLKKTGVKIAHAGAC